MRFTVLTPTYNRAHTLSGVYQSLCAQTFRDFEWVIIDDGSTDGTGDLVASWKSFFPVNYLPKVHGGLHRALNLGVAVARGEFITQVDSDDRCVPHMLERFDHHWRQIPDPDPFACLAALCCREDGTILGDLFPRDCVDTFSLRDALAMSKVDRCGLIRADIWRQFPYPEFKGEDFIIPGVVNNRILRKYAARCFNEALKVVCSGPDQMSRGPDMRFLSPRGAVLYHTELALSNVPVKMRLKSAANAARFALVGALRGPYRGQLLA